MTIDASIRRAILIAEARGFTAPDSQPTLDPSPQIIIEPGEEEVYLNFTDGKGWGTTRNTYKGYGWNFMWTHNGAPAGSITEALDDADPDDIPVYDPDTGTYLPKSADEASIAVRSGSGAVCLTIRKPEDRDYFLFLNLPYDITIEDTFFNMGAGPGSVTFPSGTIAKGDPVEFTVSGTDGTSEYLTVQISYTYDRNQAY